MKRLAAIGFLLLFAAQVKGESMIRPGWYVYSDTTAYPAVFHFTAQQQFEYYGGTKECNTALKGTWEDKGDSILLTTSWLREYCPDPEIPVCLTGVPCLPDPMCVWMTNDTFYYGRNKASDYVERFVRYATENAPFPVNEGISGLRTIFWSPNPEPCSAANPAGLYSCSTLYDGTLLGLRGDGSFSMKEKVRHEKKRRTTRGTWQVNGDTLLLYINEHHMQRLYFHKGMLVPEFPAPGEIPQYRVFYAIPRQQFKFDWNRG